MPGIDTFTPDGVRFTDGRELPFDVIIYGTGYRSNLDQWLEGASELVNERGYPKAHGAEAGRPGLYFIGFRNPPTGALREIAIEAQRIAADIARSH